MSSINAYGFTIFKLCLSCSTVGNDFTGGESLFQSFGAVKERHASPTSFLLSGCMKATDDVR